MEKKTRAESLLYWRDIIRQCNARPEGQSGKEWLIQHSIKPDNYYYWLRTIRNEEKNENDIAADAAPVFAELPVSSFMPEQKTKNRLSSNRMSSSRITIALSVFRILLQKNWYLGYWG